MAESQGTRTKGVNSKPRVFRVRNLPAHVDRLSAVELLCGLINGISVQDVHISSLAYDVDVWSWLRTKVGTMTLEKTPSALTSMLNGGEYTIAAPGLPKPLIIDYHFQGITPLNDVSDAEHKYDCLVISGLASHPFGSWQAHGHDKSFMWIRDELPQRLPGVRFVIYGYDTTLSGSTSFQIIPDLAVSLVQTMKAIGWSAPSAKPVFFLAHSLGGVVLKQALVILAGTDSHERAILTKIKGAIYFGVPSQGMSIPDIFEMLGEQPNVALVKDLSDQSDFLPRLDEQFGNISYLQRLQFFWAFETKVTPIVEKTDAPGKFARTGPGTVMVSRESATRSLCHLQPSWTIQIDENHSNMVKFKRGDHYIKILASKLESICAPSHTATPELAPQTVRKFIKSIRQGGSNPRKPSNPIKTRGKTQSRQRLKLQPEWTKPKFWDDSRILLSFRAPERDRRLEQINQKLGNTFNWAYDDPAVGLSEWLQKGEGIFWINGKPASGKSTLMKYIYQDVRTDELLRAGCWRSRARLTTASFFFHHRGNSTQKSFEGLLRSLMSQILDQEKTLIRLLYPMLADQYRSHVASSALDNLEVDIWALLDHFRVPTSPELMSEVVKIVSSERELTESRELGRHLKRLLKSFRAMLYLQPEGPFDEVELDDPETILYTYIEPSKDPNTKATSQWPEPTNWRAALILTLKRHYRRERIKADIEIGLWSRSDLEEGLRQLIGQSLFKMDLFLFLDALDEYDGRPEFIASFLQDLVQQSADPSKTSSTRIRILFSSRPWKALSDEFAACPGFQIHDYTGNDILDFCAASIPSDDTAKTLLSPLVTDIVRRARGVFLWVELVMRDLARTVLERLQLRNIQGLEQELRETLDGMPDELDNYYQVIVQRIPPGTRWESYVVLETLCRSEEDIDTETLVAIVKSSYAKSLAEAKRGPNQTSQTSSIGAEPYIKVVSGGLVEVGGFSDKGKPIMQFMHQTVKQFVLGPRFRFQLLGNNVGEVVRENGHSFITKHLFTDSCFNERFFYHARESEITMGFSQYEYFSTAPESHYSLPSGTDPTRLSSIIAMAVFTGLQLCLKNAFARDAYSVQINSVELIKLLVTAIGTRDRSKSMDYIIDMAEFLVTKGLSIDHDSPCLSGLMHHMWRKETRDGPLSLGTEYERLAVILIRAISTSRAPTEAFLSRSTKPKTILRSQMMTALLHQTTPKLVQALLAHKIDPNSPDVFGNTPIDSVLGAEVLYSPNPRENVLHQYDIVSQLVSHGGVLSCTSRSWWNEWENMCAQSGLDISVFREAKFPLWRSTKEHGRKHRSLRQYLSRYIPF